MKANLTEPEAQTIMEILSKELALPQDQIRGDARIKEDLGADSLTVISITMALEEQLDASLPDEQLEQVSTVDDLRAAVSEALRGQAA